MMNRLALVGSLALGATLGWTTIGCGGTGYDSGSDGGPDYIAAATTEDMATGSRTGDMAATQVARDMATNNSCDNKQTPPLGHHNAGLDCSNCHNGSQTTSDPNSPPHWYAAGTLYDGASSSKTVAGATIHITDKNGKSVSLVTADNGNFYTSEPLVPPLKVKGSLCPSNVAMSASATSAFCNGCHNSIFRIHIP
jgi:hypothetical protein